MLDRIGGISDWTPAEYFILKAAILCLVPFTPPALCLRCEGIDRQTKPNTRSATLLRWDGLLRWQIETWDILFFSFASRVHVSWCCAEAAKVQLRDSLSWKLRSLAITWAWGQAHNASLCCCKQLRLKTCFFFVFFCFFTIFFVIPFSADVAFKSSC